ncbi:MAG: hypothetical protein IPK20_22545 [Betaproteobacteria bacterium]|nr:hypothetical protein [Betaproteobacteria bacterium]
MSQVADGVSWYRSMPALTRRMKPRVAAKSYSPWNSERPSGTSMVMSPTVMSPSSKVRASRSGSSAVTTRTSFT